MATDVADIRAKLSLESAAFCAGAERARSSFNQMANGIAKDASAIRKTTEALGTAMKGLVAAFSVQKVVQSADAFTNMANRLNLVAKSGENVQKTLGALFALSQQNRTGLEGTVDLYTRIAQATDKFGLSQKTLVEVVDSVGKAVTLSGASAGAANDALIQLGQGLGSAALRGDELNSVIEATPRLAKAIADGMGLEGGISALRKLAAEGKVTSAAVVQALISQNDTLNTEFGKTTSTVGQAITQLSNSWLMFVGRVGEGDGFKQLASGISAFARTLTDSSVLTAAQAFGSVLGAGLKTAAAGMQLASEHARGLVAALAGVAALKVAGMVVGAVEGFLTLAKALRAAAAAGQVLELVMSRSVLGLLAKLGLAAAVAAAAYGYLGDSVKKILDPTAAFGQASADNAQDLAKLQAQIQQTTDVTDKLGEQRRKAIGDLKIEQDHLKAQLAAYQGLGPAIDTVNTAIEVDNQLRQLGLKLKSDDGRAIEALIVKNNRLKASIEGQQALNDQRDRGDQLRLQAQAYQGLGQSIDAVNTQIEVANELKRLGLSLDDEQGRAIADQITSNRALEQSIAAQQQAIEEQGRRAQQAAEEQARIIQEPILQAARNIQDALGDGIYQGLNGNLDSISDFAETFKKIMLQAIAQIAAAMIFQPVIGSITSGLAAGAASGLGSGLSGIGAALNASSFGQSINGFGANLGLSSGVAGTGFVNAAGQTVPGAVAPGIFGSTATLTSVLGAGALGALGGNLLSGLTGGTKMGSTIGGGGGAALGALLGSAVPGVGTALGGVLGGLGGSLFGGLFGNEKPSDKRQGVRLDLGTGLSDTFGQTGEKFSQANAQAAASIASSAQSFAQSLQQLTGGVLSTGFEVSKGDRDGYKLAFGNEAETTYKDQSALEDALVKKIVESLKGASGTAAQLLKSGKLDLSNSEEVLQGLNLAKTIEDLKNGGNAANSYAAQIRAVEKDYASGIAMARRLGLSEVELIKARDKQVASLRDAQKAAWAADAEAKRQARQARIDAVATPLKDAVNSFDQISQSLLDAANDRVASLSDYRKSLRYGDTGSLSRPDQLSAAAKDFRDTIAKAQGGDTSAFSDITSTAEQYRTLARQQYGSTSAYQNVNAQIEKMIAAVQKDQEARAKQLEADRKRQGLVADKTLETEQTQLVELQGLRREIRELKQQLARAQQQRAA